jgi:hypothetical protein
VRYSLRDPHAYVDANLAGFTNILEGIGDIEGCVHVGHFFPDGMIRLVREWAFITASTHMRGAVVVTFIGSFPTHNNVWSEKLGRPVKRHSSVRNHGAATLRLH